MMEPPAKPPVVLVQSRDLLLIMIIAAFAALLLVAFGYLLHLQGFLQFPDVATQTVRGDEARYYQDALDYRERRLALALVLRTFITGFAFVVGLALCTQGGIFILRQVTAFTTLSMQSPGRSGAAGATDATTTAPATASPLFSFASYSPGVVFLLGGVMLMVATQYLAIPIKWLEIVPGHAVQLCLNEETNQWATCTDPTRPTTPAAADPVREADLCKQENPPASCP